MADQRAKIASLHRLIEAIFSELGDFDLRWEPAGDGNGDVAIILRGADRTYHLEFKVRERITPQIADELFSRLKRQPSAAHVTCVVHAPVISPRVAEIAQRHGMSYIDAVGNCRIIDPSGGLLIYRRGIPNRTRADRQKTVDPFSPKSSRVVRVMLHEPERGWRVNELADHPDVNVSVGLVSKVKAALVRESYAVVQNRLLYLKQPLELLSAWSRNYPNPSGVRQYYIRGEIPEIEASVAKWCQKTANDYALARYSAAWRLAPEVRYSVASIYVRRILERPSSLESFCAECGAKEVDSGANLVVLSPFDNSVLVRCAQTPERTTSALQTYLDLNSVAGRGQDAAKSVFEKHLRPILEKAGGERREVS